MPAHTQSHGLVSVDDHEPGTNNTVLGTEAGVLVEKAYGTGAAGNTLVERQASGNVTLPATDPVAQTDAASKGYVDAKIATGVTWKELVLAREQLVDDPNGGISQAIMVALAANLTVGDTVIITDGSTTETFTAVGAAPGAFQFQVGGDKDATTTNLVASINANSTLWRAVETNGLDGYLAGSEEPQMVIYRLVPVADEPDRVYGTIAGGQADVRVVAFNGLVQDYRESSGAESDLPAADPAAKRFGFGRLSSFPIQTGDTHRVGNDNTAYTWDGDDNLWQNTDTGTSVTPGDGIDITGSKISTKTATATGAATQQYGGLVNNRTSDGTGAAAADQGYLAAQTDNIRVGIDQAANAIALIGSLGQYVNTPGSWTSSNNGDKTPTLAEFQAFLGTTAADIGNWGFMIESGGGGRDTLFLAYKVANAGALSDYRSVGLDS